MVTEMPSGRCSEKVICRKKGMIEMNNWNGIGRLTNDPDVRYTQGENSTAVARYTLAVDRKFKKDGQADADFIRCVAFGKSAEFAEKYFFKGMKIGVTGRIQTGSYKDQDGKTVYTTDIVVESQDFCEKKSDHASSQDNRQSMTDSDGFMEIPEDIEDGLPFN